MRSIMPPGYSEAAKRKRLENELREARAAELANAANKRRKRIEQEIRAEVNRRLPANDPHHWPIPVMWSR